MLKNISKSQVLERLKLENPWSAVVTTIDEMGILKYQDIDIQFVLVAAYAYNVGRNTLQAKQYF